MLNIFFIENLQYLLCNNHEFLLDKLLVYIKNSQASAPKLSLVHTSPWTALSVILLAMEGLRMNGACIINLVHTIIVTVPRTTGITFLSFAMLVYGICLA